MSHPRRLITGLVGPDLTDAERGFLADVRPAGVILFRRNVASVDQVRRLTGAVRETLGDDSLVLIDEEGGRVQRLRPPVGRLLPAAARYGELLRRHGIADGLRATRLIAELTAADLKALGIDTNCAPVLDLRFAGAHDIVGDRAYGSNPDDVIPLATQVAQGFISGGVLPVMKHIPGHGRAHCDSHITLPIVHTDRATLIASDFVPFRSMRLYPAAMTAHVVYTAIDDSAPATVSKAVIGDVIRTHIGFDGLLMTDDLSMKALSGSLAKRASDAIAAGCDLVLHCNGHLGEMLAVAGEAPLIDGDSLRRFEAALTVTRLSPQAFSQAEAEALLDELLTPATAACDPTEPYA